MIDRQTDENGLDSREVLKKQEQGIVIENRSVREITYIWEAKNKTRENCTRTMQRGNRVKARETESMRQIRTFTMS